MACLAERPVLVQVVLDDFAADIVLERDWSQLKL